MPLRAHFIHPVTQVEVSLGTLWPRDVDWVPDFSGGTAEQLVVACLEHDFGGEIFRVANYLYDTENEAVPKELLTPQNRLGSVPLYGVRNFELPGPKNTMGKLVLEHVIPYISHDQIVDTE